MKLRTFCAAAAACIFSITAAQASTVGLNTDDGQVYVSQNGIGSSAVAGAWLAGMNVDVDYVDGGHETLTWNAVNSSLGRAASSDFSLSNEWWEFTLSTTRLLKSFSMSVLGLDSVFDIYPLSAPYTDTPGSLRGVAFNVIEGDQDGIIDVLFKNKVLVAGHMTGEDLFTDMSVDFSGLAAGGFLGDMRFVTDLDKYAVSGDLSPLAAPLPAGLPLMLGGFGLLGLVRRKRR